MAWFLFMDESGHDRVASPDEVLAGIAIRDSVLWDLIRSLHESELRFFGRRYSDGQRELKGSLFLKGKVSMRLVFMVQTVVLDGRSLEPSARCRTS